MGTTSVYNRGKFNIGRGIVVLDQSDIRVLLVNSGYVFSAAHDTVADITFELGGTGYARKALVGKTMTENDGGGFAVWDANDVTWLGASFTGAGLGGGTPDAAILYLEGSSDVVRQLICCIDITPKAAPVGADFVLQFGAAGIMKLV